MPMSKKDFVELAAIIHEHYSEECWLEVAETKEVIESIVSALEDFCAARNPLFLRKRFRRACFGPNPTPTKIP